MLSVPEMDLSSSFLFSSDQLECALHLLLSPVSLQQVFPVQLVFELIYNPLGHSGEASIHRNSPSSRSESAMLSAESYWEYICDWR